MNSGNIAVVQEEFRRVHILGGPGSGKTFLAKRLSENMGITRTDLDDLFWDNTASNYNTRRSPDERDRLLNEVIGQDQWIVEGVHHAWLLESFEKADIIVVLNTCVWLRHWRILRRFLCRRLSRGDHPRRETLASLWSLLKWNHAYNGDNLRRTQECLRPYRHKVKVFSGSNDALRTIMNTSEISITS